MMQKFLTAVSVVTALLFGAQAAQAEDWSVVRKSGDVQVIESDLKAASLGPDGVVRSGDRIVTGASGRVMLKRGAETIIIAPGTELIVPTFNTTPGRTTLLQSRGSATFEVEKRNVQHFEVETPFLAAVVKGTRFVVDVTAAGASVKVDRGVVEVFDLDTGQVGLIKAGQQAATHSAAGAGLNVTGDGEKEALTMRAPRKSLLETGKPQERQASLVPADKSTAMPAKAQTRETAAVKVGAGSVTIARPIGRQALAIGKVSNNLAESSRERRAAASARNTGAVASASNSSHAATQATGNIAGTNSGLKLENASSSGIANSGLANPGQKLQNASATGIANSVVVPAAGAGSAAAAVSVDVTGVTASVGATVSAIVSNSGKGNAKKK